jgi:uncharacterized surface protein with fasciclin (FAS1) repeats
MTINRSINGIETIIYRKTSSTDITIQNTSKHTQDHKNAEYRYCTNRKRKLPNTERARKHERKYILSTAKHNDIPAHEIVQDSKFFDCRIKEYVNIHNILLTYILHGTESFLRS